jgi:hypothetical protein
MFWPIIPFIFWSCPEDKLNNLIKDYPPLGFWWRLRWALSTFMDVHLLGGPILVADFEGDLDDEIVEEYMARKKDRIWKLNPYPTFFEMICLRRGISMKYYKDKGAEACRRIHERAKQENFPCHCGCIED